ncbi:MULTISPECIES: hypothetical protein [Enterococcus]|nr:hypothetical protein [Enterococcus malodoratus]
MKKNIKEVISVAHVHGYEKLKDIKMMDKTRYSALIGKLDCLSGTVVISSSARN